MVGRREFLKLGAAAAALASTLGNKGAVAQTKAALARDGADFSYLTGTEREALPTVCAQCFSRCPAVAYVEQERLVKIEGQPKSVRTRGKLCARGQAGVDQLYDPDRILYPLKRVGKRGEGKWKRITWPEALEELVARLRVLRDEGRPENFMVHHGWISASSDRLINKVFLPAYGTATVANQTCLGQSGRQTAFDLTWGGSEDSWDFDNTNFILNFGSNVIEAHTNHVALSQRLALALSDRHIRVVTFDVRLSNTANKSSRWVPIRPGTDLAVVLAMCQVVMDEDLYLGAGEAFLEFCKVTPWPDASVADKVAALKAHLAQYTPQWAEEISGVPAPTIRETAIEFATTKPACIISSRGATANYNGVETERAIQMLAAITGSVDTPGGRCLAVVPEWRHPSGPEDKPEPRKLDILNGFEGDVAFPTRGVGHKVFEMIRNGRAGRPEVYLWYTYNPVYANGDVQANIDVLGDESLIPYAVCVSPFYDESAALADLILPDTTYLESYDFEDGISPTQTPEFAVRQPVVPPMGEARDFKDVCCELAKRLGIPLGFDSGEKFVEASCRLTPEVARKAGGFTGMKRNGVWSDANALPRYDSYRQEVAPAALNEDGVIFDEANALYWNWKRAGAADEAEAVRQGYNGTPGAYREYVGQKIGDKVYVGFRPGRIDKSGFFEIYSRALEGTGRTALPSFVAIPEHASLKATDLILTTFKVNVHTLSRTQNCRWLNEVYHDTRALINSASAAAIGVNDGDRIRIASPLGAMETRVRIAQTVIPGVIAISAHGGRWQGGRYASGNALPIDPGRSRIEQRKWWSEIGAHPNWIIPNAPEPISGQQRWMDTVVTVNRVDA